MGQLRRAIVALVALVAAYEAYALLVVPRIDPPTEARTRDPSQSAVVITTVADRHPREFADLFPPDAWELDRPKVVETEQGILLFKDYRALDDGRMELTPCSLICFLSAGQSSVRSGRRVMVMLVPEGAVFQFEGDADTTRGQFGRLVGGSLRGEVRVHAPESRPGANDQIDATTHGVKIDEQRIWTPQRVEFRFGANHGSGSELTVGFAARIRSKSGSQFASSVGGLASLRLEHLDQLHLEPSLPQEQPQAADQTLAAVARQKLFPLEARVPLTVACQGAFEFSFEDSVATFEDDVVVERIVSDAVRDHLRCEHLSIFFRRRGVTAESSAESGRDPQGKGVLEPARIVAKGRPVILQAPSFGASSQADYLEYNLLTREFHLRDGNRAELRHLRTVIKTPEIKYQLAEDPQRLGVAWAAGPGQLVTSSTDDETKSLTISWDRELRIRPDDDSHLISLTSKVVLESAAMGRVQADELHVWVAESLAETVAAGRPIGAHFDLDRLLANGSVLIESPRISSHTDRLEA